MDMNLNPYPGRCLLWGFNGAWLLAVIVDNPGDYGRVMKAYRGKYDIKVRLL